MFTNVREQKYEIAILRSIGLTRFQIARVYIHEAFILLLASATLGSIIGIIMAFLLMHQRSVLTQIPLQITYPWTLGLQVIAISFFSALGTSLCSLRKVNAETISQIFRSV